MGICRCTQRACERQGPEKRAATVGSRLSPHGVYPNCRTCTTTTTTVSIDCNLEISVVCCTGPEKRPLRHDRVVDDFAQFDTVRTCLCKEEQIHHFDDELK